MKCLINLLSLLWIENLKRFLGLPLQPQKRINIQKLSLALHQ